MELPDFVAFDTETTGIEKDSRVIEIAGVRFRGDVVLGEYSRLIDPGVPIPKGASDVNHIHDEMVSSCPAFNRVILEFSLFAEDSLWIAHNAMFDIDRLAYELSLLDGTEKTNRIKHLWFFDTLEMARKEHPEWKKYKLGELVKRIGSNHANTHRGLDDAKAVMDLFNFLTKDLPKERLRTYCRRFHFERNRVSEEDQASK